MTNYPEIRKTLSLCSVDIGLSNDSERTLLKRMLCNIEWRKKFEEEIISAFSDTSTPWTELLFNEEYEVVEADTEKEAREIAAEMLWKAAFPDKPLPSLHEHKKEA